MKTINATHSKIIKEMLTYFNVGDDKEVEALTTKEILEGLMNKVDRTKSKKLLSFLDKHDFYTAPASTRFHGNYDGGLAEHSINVCALLLQMNQLHNGGLSDETIIISGLMHDLCKVDFYKRGFRNVKDDKTGAWYKKPIYEVEDHLPLPHGSKSLYILQGFIKVTREEAFLITWHMGPYASLNGDNYGFNNALDYQPNCGLLYVADFLASSLYEVKID